MRPFSAWGCRLASAAVLVFTILLVTPLPTIGGSKDDAKSVRIGVLAVRGVDLCRAQWTPTAEYLTHHVPGYRFVIVPLPFGAVEAAVERGEIDFMFSNPTVYILLERRYNAGRIATLKNLSLGKVCTVYGGVIFCQADRTDLITLRSLKGKTFMAVDKESLGGWCAAWRELKDAGIDPYRDFRSLLFAGTHDGVVEAVRRGDVDAGTVRTDTLE